MASFGGRCRPRSTAGTVLSRIDRLPLSVVHEPMTFFRELKRRNVFRAGLAYLLASWVLLQIIDFVLQVIAAPNWVLQVFVLAAAMDQHPFGTVALNAVMVWCGCGAPWDLQSTPNFTALVQESRLNWPPPALQPFPLKDG